jgi:hypothetical protein
MNKGIRVAKGEYLQFLNSGDWLCNNDTLQKVFNNNLNDVDIAYGNYLTKDGTMVCPPEELDSLFLYRSTISHQNLFIKRTLFQSALYDESYSVVSDWFHLFSSLLFENASYKKN